MPTEKVNPSVVIEGDEPSYKTYPELARLLMMLRAPTDRDGPTKEERDKEIMGHIMDFLLERGIFLRCPLPIYFDRRVRKVFRVERNSPDLAYILHSMGLLDGQLHFKMARDFIANEAGRSPIRQRYGFAFCDPDATTVYFRAERGAMYRVTADAIDTVPLGHDGVLLLDDDVADFPALETLQPIIDELRPLIGKRTILPVKNSPMAKLTTRWSTNSHFTRGQAQAMFLGRLMFFGFAGSVKIWPLTLLTGEQGSGKSTACEMWASFLADADKDAPTLPTNMRDFLAAATNQSFLFFDQTDGARLDDPKKSEYSDYICSIATGGMVSMAVLFQTNVLAKFSIRNHAFFTAREYPFNRSDIARRLIHLEVEPMIGHQPVRKMELIKDILASRDRIMAEYLIRTQNIIRAISDTRGREYPLGGEMPDYQHWTLQCADHEGELPKMERLWTAFNECYKLAITENSAIAYAIQVWLGSHYASGGQDPKHQLGTTLFHQVRKVLESKEIPFSFRSPTAFSHHLGNNLEALGVVGMKKQKNSQGTFFSFTLSEPQRKHCITLYRQEGVFPSQKTEQPDYAACDDSEFEFGPEAPRHVN